MAPSSRRRNLVKNNKHWISLAVAVFVLACGSGWAAPFAKKVTYTQPDGTVITLFGQGDEFYAEFETLDGYAVVFTPATKTYHYAKLSADGTELKPVGPPVGQVDPAQLGLTKHQRVKTDARRKQAQERFRQWDQAMLLTERWQATKAAWRQAEADAAATGGPVLAPPGSTTSGGFQRRPGDNSAGGNRQLLQRHQLHRLRQQRLRPAIFLG
jgi:hypothetical protein